MQDMSPWAIEETLRICRGLLDGSIPMIDGCRQITSLRNEMGATGNSVFDIFVVVDSDSDHLPFGNVRQHCSPEWLQKADAEIADIESLYREPVRKAAEALLRTLPTEAGDS